MRRDYAFEFQKSLLPMIAEQLITPEGAVIMTDKVSELLETYSEELADKLRTMISEWESVMDEEDKTLYSLGLRRAVDVVLEADSTVEWNNENKDS